MKITKSSSSPFTPALVPASAIGVGQPCVGPTSREVLIRVSANGHSISAKQGRSGLLPFVLVRTGALRMVSPDAKLAKADATLTASAADAGSIATSSF